MTVLLACVALMTLAIFSFAAVITCQILRERRSLVDARPHRTRATIGDSDEEEVSDVASCLQAWLDERWNERFR